MPRTIGLGCMRLSTQRERDESRSVAVIRAALDAGATLLDTSDAYCLDETDTGHNERLIARALSDWDGDRARITVATKGGMRRPKGGWIPDGRAKHLRNACDASRHALGVETIDLYQLHVVDPKTSIETSVRALARLRDEGKIRDIGLCNVTVNQIRAAQAVAPIAAVQVSMSPFDDDNLRNGVAELCRDEGIRLIAYRPLGGERISRLTKDVTLTSVAAKHGVTPATIVLAWLMSLYDNLIPVPGATRVETAGAVSDALQLMLDDDDRRALDTIYSGRLLRVPRAQRRPRADAIGDVVIVMGMPGAGKTSMARDLETQGYERLNRDAEGGSLAELIPRLDTLLAAGTNRIVLDNTYPTRKSRNEVIEAAWRRGVPVRCVWLTTDVAASQINSVRRMIAAHGALPSPEEIRQLGKSDSRYLLPDAQFRYERTLEPPTVDEGFSSVDTRDFIPTPTSASRRAVIFDFDELVSGHPALRRTVLTEYVDDGWLLFAHAWRPQIERGEATTADVEASFGVAREQLGVGMHVAYCPHIAGPPVCWCRKPIPGSVLQFAHENDVALRKSIVVVSSAADRTMAERIGARPVEPSTFYSE